jgi:hypothetical protein
MQTPHQTVWPSKLCATLDVSRRLRMDRPSRLHSSIAVVARSVGRLLAAFAALASSGVAAAAQTVTFGDGPAGSIPRDFETGVVGGGGPGKWEIVADPTAAGGRALAQVGTDRTDYRYLTASYSSVVAANVDVTTRFKAVAGQVDRAGGLVVRLVDANNYYVARANALEDNVRFYRVVQGKRQELASADIKVVSGAWHTLTLRAEGDLFTVLFNGKPMHATKDTTSEPRPERGKVGVWTKADSVTYFDRIEIKTLP